VLWKVKPTGVGDYLFNIQNPEGTVKAVAESAMREVVGRSEIQPILTGARQTVETAVQDLMQRTLDHYGSGILVQQVQLQKVDPPMQVIDAFRDVQAARIDQERAQNEAQTYANRVVPEARGRVAQITQAAEAYRQQTVAEATGQTSRFLKILERTRRRLTSLASACIWKRWSACWAPPTNTSSIPTKAGRALCPIFRSLGFRSPSSSAASQPEASNETQCFRRRAHHHRHVLALLASAGAKGQSLIYPRQTITAQSSPQIRRFPHLINADKVFGTHTGASFPSGASGRVRFTLRVTTVNPNDFFDFRH